MKMKNVKLGKALALILIMLLSVGLLSGCKRNKPVDSQNSENLEAQEESDEGKDAQEPQNEDQDSVEEGETSDAGDQSLPEDGLYNSKDDVALYLHLYGHLPDNYITKHEARSLGWSGGSVEKYGENLAIGGDKFGNYEGVLPDGPKYYECDIDTWGRSKRGAKRIIWSDRGEVYYTEDHYESFEQLY